MQPYKGTNSTQTLDLSPEWFVPDEHRNRRRISCPIKSQISKHHPYRPSYRVSVLEVLKNYMLILESLEVRSGLGAATTIPEENFRGRPRKRRPTGGGRGSGRASDWAGAGAGKRTNRRGSEDIGHARAGVPGSTRLKPVFAVGWLPAAGAGAGLKAGARFALVTCGSESVAFPAVTKRGCAFVELATSQARTTEGCSGRQDVVEKWIVKPRAHCRAHRFTHENRGKRRW